MFSILMQLVSWLTALQLLTSAHQPEISVQKAIWLLATSSSHIIYTVQLLAAAVY